MICSRNTISVGMERMLNAPASCCCSSVLTLANTMSACCLRGRLEGRCEGAAGRAPRRPEIDDDRSVLVDQVLEVVHGQFDGCHEGSFQENRLTLNASARPFSDRGHRYADESMHRLPLKMRIFPQNAIRAAAALPRRRPGRCTSVPWSPRPASYLDARARRGEWLLRIEDVDTPRNVPACGATRSCAPWKRSASNGTAPWCYQSAPVALYREALAEPAAHGSASSPAPARGARLPIPPWRGDGARRYPGTCRQRLAARARRARLSRAASSDGIVCFDDRPAGPRLPGRGARSRRLRPAARRRLCSPTSLPWWWTMPTRA